MEKDASDIDKSASVIVSPVASLESSEIPVTASSVNVGASQTGGTMTEVDKSNVSKALQQEIDNRSPRARRIKRLIDQGAEINYQAPEDGYTALMLAVDTDNHRITEYLLTLGANPLFYNHNYEMASDLALRNSPVYLMLKDYELLFATLSNDLDSVKFILDAGAIVNFQAPDGYTALLIAVDQSLVDMTKLLLSKGADILIKRADGKGVFELVTDEEVYLLLQSEMPVINYDENHSQNLLELTRSTIPNYIPSKKPPSFFFGSNSNNHSEKIEQSEITDENYYTHELIPFSTSQLKIRPHLMSGFELTATEEQIKDLENTVGHALPESYKDILRHYNGGIPELTYFDADEERYSLNYFYCLGDRKDLSINIWWAINGFSALAGKETLPFGESGTNDVYFFKWIDEIAQVWILRYDELNEPESDFVSHSFDELLSMLHDDNS